MKPQLHRPSVTLKRAVLAAADAADGNMTLRVAPRGRMRIEQLHARLIEAESR